MSLLTNIVLAFHIALIVAYSSYFLWGSPYMDKLFLLSFFILNLSWVILKNECLTNYVFKKFTLLCAINNKKCIGANLYKEGGMTKERFVEFLEENIFNKYKDNLIVLDNAGSHNNQYVKDAILKSDNKYLFSVPYNPKTNRCIEEYFNQIKYYLKLNKKI